MKYLFLTITFIFTSLIANAQKADKYIFHKVQPKETLYSLVKKYNTNFATVENLNPILADGRSDIQVGQIIKFPKNTPDIPEKDIKAGSLPKEGRVNPKVHVVQAKETIFSISKRYNIDISNLIEANKIENNTIKTGQKLLIDATEIAKIATESPREKELRLEPTGKNIKETGLAEVINSSRKSTKYLALHRTAPVGSTMKITNEATGHSVVARVIGKLSEKGPDQNIMVKLSPYAYYQLRPTDIRLRATVEYYLPFNKEDGK